MNLRHIRGAMLVDLLACGFRHSGRPRIGPGQEPESRLDPGSESGVTNYRQDAGATGAIASSLWRCVYVPSSDTVFMKWSAKDWGLPSFFSIIPIYIFFPKLRLAILH